MLLEIKVKPGSSEDRIIQFREPNFLEISLKAPPEKNKANERLSQFLSKVFKIPKNQVKIVKGKTSKNKIIKIEGIIEKEAIKIIKKTLEKIRE
ncbi:MAG: hypothetical protein C0190_00665 [Thermodesulfobacterium geofontis]|mgnify:CR=1 FL=1|uniref:UPF0235 protein C0169_00890 n=1 Tax=Thermodesulfobacterium geofontis TaxID=1295609 RepID=A0A2N7PQD7_9BACT|nr:MAG: hypothetical protein C0190_00665 [Thermodesulfobacterium geofontis]PMP98053.1 MAG: hypothetical protein C0169_00890 [Thermodesulfobacterium geofontis]